MNESQEENNNEEPQPSAVRNRTSIQRYILNVVVRLLFFFGFSPILYFFPNFEVDTLFKLPYGMILFVVLGTLGAILDIFLPKNFVLGGKLVIWAFNFSTLTWFEGLEFSVSVNAGFQGKGVSIKDERE